jgi:hypothetical protein
MCKLKSACTAPPFFFSAEPSPPPPPPYTSTHTPLSRSPSAWSRSGSGANELDLALEIGIVEKCQPYGAVALCNKINVRSKRCCYVTCGLNDVHVLPQPLPPS